MTEAMERLSERTRNLETLEISGLDWDDVWADAVHDHSSAAEGGATLGFTAMTGVGVTVPDGWHLGFGAAAGRIVFDNTLAPDVIAFMDVEIGVGTLTPGCAIDVGGVNASWPGGLLTNTIASGGGTAGRFYLEGSTQADITLDDSGGAVDEKIFQLVLEGGKARFRGLTDAIGLSFNFLGMDLGTGYVGFGTVTPGSLTEWNFATEDLEFVDAGSAGATAQDWIEVQVGGNTGYIRVYNAK